MQHVFIMVKTILSGFLLVAAAVPASADSDRGPGTYGAVQSERNVRNADREALKDAEAAHRAAGARVATVQKALRRSERDLRSAQRQLDALTKRYNAASQANRTRDARVLLYRLDRLISRTGDLEAKRDFQRARLTIARVDYGSAKEQLMTAARVVTNRDEG